MSSDFSVADFTARAAKGLLQVAPQLSVRSDDDLNRAAPLIPADEAPKLAAVLVPVVARKDGLSLLLTKRTAHLSKHPGQIAFPGGRIDDDDETALAAALREAEEEIGLSRSFVTPLGFLDGYRTVTNFHVVPVVALVREGFALRRQTEEVAEVFEVPLAFLMTPKNHERHSKDWNGIARHFYAMPYGDYYIWGATAGMLRNMYDKLYGQNVAAV
jgi:8-oxo-dGTP pyrophosphatase MutT (NUDIX family)